MIWQPLCDSRAGQKINSFSLDTFDSIPTCILSPILAICSNTLFAPKIVSLLVENIRDPSSTKNSKTNLSRVKGTLIILFLLIYHIDRNCSCSVVI